MVFSNLFSSKKCLILWFKLHGSWFLRVQLTIVSIGSGNGLVPMMRKAISWTKVEPGLRSHRGTVTSPQWVKFSVNPFQFFVLVHKFGHGTTTDNRESSWCQLYRHWWHRRISSRQTAVPPMTTKLTSWQLLVLMRALTTWSRVTHICVGKLGHHSFRQWLVTSKWQAII